MLYPSTLTHTTFYACLSFIMVFHSHSFRACSMIVALIKCPYHFAVVSLSWIAGVSVSHTCVPYSKQILHSLSLDAHSLRYHTQGCLLDGSTQTDY